MWYNHISIPFCLTIHVLCVCMCVLLYGVYMYDAYMPVEHTSVHITHTHTSSPPVACFSRMEDLCAVLQSNRKRLEVLWHQKADQLDKVLQLRVFEHDSEQLAQWFLQETNSLSHEHTDIGDGQSVAEARRRAFEEFRGRAMVCSLVNSSCFQ